MLRVASSLDNVILRLEGDIHLKKKEDSVDIKTSNLVRTTK